MEVCWVGVHEAAEARVVVIEGELDCAGADRVDAMPHRVADVIVDVRGVTFVDAAGLGALIRLHRDAQAAGKKSVWRGKPTCLMRVLSIVGMVDAFAFESSPPPRGDRLGRRPMAWKGMVRT